MYYSSLFLGLFIAFGTAVDPHPVSYALPVPSLEVLAFSCYTDDMTASLTKQYWRPILLDVGSVEVRKRSAQALERRVVAALILRATKAGLSLADLCEHLQALSCASCPPEMVDSAKSMLGCLAAYLKTPRAACVLAERAVLEARAICTGDVLCLPHMSVKHLSVPEMRSAQALTAKVFLDLGCQKYYGSSSASGHPASRLRHRLARWFLVPKTCHDPEVLAAMFMPGYDWSALV